MNIRTTLLAKLDASTGVVSLVGTRIFPVLVPQNITADALAYRVDDTIREVDLAGDAGWGQTRFEVTCHSATYVGAVTLADAVVTALHNWGSNASTSGVWDSVADNELDSYNDGSKRFELPLDFVLKHSTT